ncbi:MAG: hypothetical protein HYV20_07570 [Gemmatimonadetes bacterium]|nr:hypothetical protein [Gemmatimonadota bacterium]
MIWVHAASVGEALTALPVCRRLKSGSRTSAIALTYTSPSAERWPGGWPVDRADYLPPDLPAPMQAMLEALRPRLLIFSRADVWPELTTAAMGRGIPVAILGATVGPRSGRLGWPVRHMFRPVYAAIAYAGAASNPDADRLARLGVRPAVLDVTGDPRHDQVLERIPDGKVLRRLADWTAPGEVLVAGSTEPTDDTLLLEAFAEVHLRRPAARLLVCPHDLGPRRSEQVAAHARRRGLEAAVWAGGAPQTAAPCLIVERAGMLDDLYAVGALAYVGGGFGWHGVHAVIEPASYAVPVIVGPRGHGADTIALLRAGGAVALPRLGAAQALVHSWEAAAGRGASAGPLMGSVARRRSRPRAGGARGAPRLGRRCRAEDRGAAAGAAAGRCGRAQTSIDER